MDPLMRRALPLGTEIPRPSIAAAPGLRDRESEGLRPLDDLETQRGGRTGAPQLRAAGLHNHGAEDLEAQHCCPAGASQQRGEP